MLSSHVAPPQLAAPCTSQFGISRCFRYYGKHTHSAPNEEKTEVMCWCGCNDGLKGAFAYTTVASKQLYTRQTHKSKNAPRARVVTQCDSHISHPHTRDMAFFRFSFSRDCRETNARDISPRARFTCYLYMRAFKRRHICINMGFCFCVCVTQVC